MIKVLGKIKKVFAFVFKNKKAKVLLKRATYIIFFSIVIVLLRVFVFEFYRVESCSMEETLFTGDVILVNKLKYGARLPMQPKDIPFFEALAYITGFHSWALETQWKYRRVPGIGRINRGDIVVFSHPKKEENLIKRCTGLPGDTFLISHNQLFVNNILQTEPLLARYSFYIKTKNGILTDDTLKYYGISNKQFLWRHDSIFHIALTYNVAQYLKQCSMVDSVFIDDFPKGAKGPALFPTPEIRFTRENFGPFIIPAKNTTLELDTGNIVYYREVIISYENNELWVTNGKIYINNLEVKSYTFKMNYYFMMGDNRYHSIDSRYWGFVPESSIIGKSRFMLLSIDKDKQGFNKIRGKRICKTLQ